MGIFSEIWDRITVSDEERRQHQQEREQAKAKPVPQGTPAPKPAATPVDVEAVLEQKAAQKGGGGNWRTSIVDLLKLLDLDSSLAAPKNWLASSTCMPETMAAQDRTSPFRKPFGRNWRRTAVECRIR